jgi:hypothetical protein
MQRKTRVGGKSPQFGAGDKQTISLDDGAGFYFVMTVILHSPLKGTAYPPIIT